MQTSGGGILACQRRTAYQKELQRASLIHSGPSSSKARCSCIPLRVTSQYHPARGRPEDRSPHVHISAYLRFAERAVRDIISRTRVGCGLAGIENVETGELEDRMHSFALGETLKYAYLILYVFHIPGLSMCSHRPHQ